MRLTKREKIMVSLCGIAVLGFLYFQFAYKPESARIKQLKGELSQKTVMLQQANSGKLSLNKITADTEKIDKELLKEKERLLQPVRLPEILTELDSVAAKNDISIENIGFEGDFAVKGETKSSGNNPAAQNQAVVTGDSSQAGQNGEQQPQGSNNENTLYTENITFDFSGNYNNYINFMKYYENHKKIIITDTLDISAKGGICTGKISMKIYSLKKDKDDYRYNPGNTTTRNSPFK